MKIAKLLFFLTVCIKSFCVVNVTWNDVTTPSGTAALSTARGAPMVINSSGQKAFTYWLDSSDASVKGAFSTDSGVTWTQVVVDSLTGNTSTSVGLMSNDGLIVQAFWRATDSLKCKYSFDGGQTWPTSAVTISEDSTTSIATGSVKANGSTSGQYLVVTWQPTEVSTKYVKFAYSSDYGQTWSTPENLTSFTSTVYSLYPKLEISDDGQNVIWFGRIPDTSLPIVKTPKVSYSTDFGHTWSSLTTILPAGITSIGSIDLSSNSTNEKAVLVMNNTIGTDRVYVSYTADYSASWSTPTQISQDSGGFQDGYADINMDSFGTHSICVWRQVTGGDRHIMSSYSFDYGVTWSAPVDIAQHETTEDDEFVQNLAIDSSGDYSTTIWENHAVTPYTINTSQYAKFGGDVAVDVPETLSSASVDSRNSNVLKSSTNGKIFTWWREGNSAPYTLRIRVGTIDNWATLVSCSKQTLVRFLTQAELKNDVIWSSIPNASTYKVYDNSALTTPIATVTSSGLRLDTIHQRKRGTTYTYYVTWINSLSQESSPITITLP
jgi:hypothetical protein